MARVSSITRVLQIIETVSAANRPLTPLDLSEILDIPKPSMHRLIQQLQVEGFLRVDLNGTIVPARRTHRMAFHLWQNKQATSQRRAILQRLVDDIGETCGIAVPYNLQMVYTDHVQTQLPLQIYLPIGSHSPMWCTSTGKLYLSTLKPNERQHILQNLPLSKFTKNTITNIEQLNLELDRSYAEQLAIDNEEFISEMVAISVPITDAYGRYMASLYVHAPTIRLSLKELKAFEHYMRKASENIHQVFFG